MARGSTAASATRPCETIADSPRAGELDELQARIDVCNEAEADLFGLNASRQPDGFAEVALKLGEYRKLDPGPVEEWIFFDHPSGRERILMAMRFKAAQLAAGETTGAAGAPPPAAAPAGSAPVAASGSGG